MKKESPSQSDLRDELAKIWREIENLHKIVESIRRELVFRKETVGELPIMPSERYPVETALERTEQDCNIYVDVIRDIDIVRQVLLAQAQTGAATTIWTIIDDPPPEDSPLKSIYDDKLHTLQILKHNMPFNSDLLTMAQLSDKEKLRHPTMKIMWQC